MDSALLFKHLYNNGDRIACWYQQKSYSYKWLLSRCDELIWTFSTVGVVAGTMVSLIADYHPDSLASLLALIRLKAIVQPMTRLSEEAIARNSEICSSEFQLWIDEDGFKNIGSTGMKSEHALIDNLRLSGQAGLIIMSSGTSGQSKAIVHNLEQLISVVKPSLQPRTVLSFLLFDHIGGINTILSAFASGNCLVVPELRTPESISEAISRYQVDVLITSPSFLNLMILKNCFENRSLQVLKQINYGSEVMPASILSYLAEKLPTTRMIQAYGLSEAGVIKTRSDDNQSTFIRIVDDGVQVRVRENKLEVLSKTSMLGYMNAPSPFTSDGWLITGDVVEVRDNSFRIVGRDTEVINVGGEKVYPGEVENIILQLTRVEDVVVSAEKNAILGNIVVARIKASVDTDFIQLRREVILWCKKHLPLFKVPQKITFVNEVDYGLRFKKKRQPIA
ncbi:ANL family adenylate-forming protein [Xenorhabdus eapokensis]|uniref:Acyl-CoA dehydrogenase n=1 Tax=Xenorhabdus eapokensis TaxID=1873482 RepID=A0A1Q5TGZ1_9GAMM|nr:fatty acid--CoA ligase family protein [Xenorhabdus eapokensis]OKO99471.1 acyl-CoA dehydrogenase [Xenorhabdus eapokensis]